MSGTPWLRQLSSPFAAAVILLGFWIAMVASLREKSFTGDEAVHATAGYTRWRFDDYRINPENGNLPQRWIALPLLAGNYAFPPLDTDVWRRSNAEEISEQWFDRMGNDTAGMLFRGRTMSGLLAVALGGLVWWWSRRIFGPAGGLISLLLFVLDPTILANGALMTSDTASALFFLASLFGLWTVLHRVTPGRLLLSALAMGALFVSKMSAVLIVPIAVVLCLIRLFAGPPVDLQIGPPRSLRTRRSRAAAFLAIAAVHAAVVIAVIWGFHGFRYQVFGAESPAGSRLEEEWTELLGTPRAAGQPATARVLEFVREHHLLPEAYVYGQAHTWKFSRQRIAFLNGQIGLTGWWWFFPYTFLAKTPLSIFGVIVLAAAALRRRPLYDTIPLWLLFGAYWAVAIATPLNIGHRHILPTYPPLFILCGAAGCWLTAAAPAKVPGRSRAPRLILAGLMAALAVETALDFPNYLSYVNVIAGGAARGYRHLVDSSLDWGQDLPGLKQYLEDHPEDQPAYFSYFGTASPDSYQIPAHYLRSVRGQDVAPAIQYLDLPADQARPRFADLQRRHPEYQVVGGSQKPDGWVDVLLLQSPASLRLSPGTYFISATMLQPLMYEYRGALGPWNERYERMYQLLYSVVKPLLSDDLAVRNAALPQRTPNEWAITLDYFEQFRFARLTAFLRQKEPSDNINGSILVYHLDAADIARVVDGPPPELGEDLPVLSGNFQPPPAP
jgi:hypothetical protein